MSLCYNVNATNRLIPEKMASHHPVVALFPEINTREVFMGVTYGRTKKCKVEDCNNLNASGSTLCCMHKYRWEMYKSYEKPKSRSERFLDYISEYPEGIVKICSVHGELDADQVYKHKNKKNKSRGYIYVCKKCVIDWHHSRDCKKHGKLLPNQRAEDGRCKTCRNEKEYAKQLYKKFRMTSEEYNRISKKQNYLCAICFQPETRKRRDGYISPLAVDHCHTTGKVRGLLCNSCNRGLGYFVDNSAALKNAAKYIEYWNKEHE